MAGLLIRRFPDSILKTPARLVDRIDGKATRLIDQLVATMRSHARCVGLAAPQVGFNLRIAVMDATGHPKAGVSHGLIVLVNPQMLAMEGSVLQREGCLSIPDFTANVRRATRVHLRAYDRDGRLQEFWLADFEAIIAQHEVDHLDGTLFLDRVANLAMDVFHRKSYS